MKQFKFIYAVVTFAFIWSCTKDFVVKKITDATVVVLAPANNISMDNNAVTFWWEQLEGADKYNVQVVKPDFAQIRQLIADTNVTGTKLVLSLTPGSYQWRIKGVNGGGSSLFSTYSFKIDTSGNLSSQSVVPLGPANNFVSASQVMTFSWIAVFTATKYNIQVNSTPAIDQVITGTSFTATFTPGTYTWKVKALNDISVSPFNTPQNFKIDLTAPAPPTNLFVTGSFNTKIADTLKWKRSTGPNSGDIRLDSLYIYGDAALTEISTATVAAVQKINISLLLSAPNASTSLPYWWRVKSIDSVGNRSAFSNLSTFTLTP